jgi:hypothetical protein
MLSKPKVADLSYTSYISPKIILFRLMVCPHERHLDIRPAICPCFGPRQSLEPAGPDAKQQISARVVLQFESLFQYSKYQYHL